MQVNERMDYMNRQKKLLSALAILGITFFSSNRVEAQGHYSGEVIPGRFIVKLKAGADPQAVARDHHLAPTAIYKHALKGFAGPASPGEVAELRKDSRVQNVEPDRLIFLTDPRPNANGKPGGGGTPAPAQVIPSGVRRIGAHQNTMGSYNGTGAKPVNVDVAVIDTGIDLTHPDLNVKANISYVIGTRNGKDDNGHGTHVAGTIAARDNSVGAVGTAPGANLWAVKVLDRNGSGNLSAVVAGIDFVTRYAGTIKVANMSLGMEGTTDAGNTAINNAVAAGVTFVVAAGNSTKAASGFWPAANPNVITVSALSDYNGTGPSGTVGQPSGSIQDPDDSFASYSNFGSPVAICAPGTQIFSTYKDGGYATFSGTSMASPHVAGSAALFIAYEKSLVPPVVPSPQAVKSALQSNAKFQDDADFGLRVKNNPGTEPVLYSAVLTAP
jgi:subtilisin